MDIQEASSSIPDLTSAAGHLSGLVELSAAALGRGDLDEALRLTDRAVRLSKNNHHIQILRGTVLLTANQPKRAVEHFTKAILAGGSPEGDVGLAYALLTLGDIPAAANRADSLLKQFSVDGYPSLLPLVRRVCQSFGGGGLGWTSITSDGHLIGAIDKIHRQRKSRLVVTGLVSGRVIAKARCDRLPSRGDRSEEADGYLDFAFTLSASDYAEAIRVSLDGQELLGSPAKVPSANQIEGFVDRVGDRITGWVTLAGYPKARLAVRLIDQDGAIQEFGTDLRLDAGDEPEGSTSPGAYSRFDIDLARIGLNGSRVEIWGWLPDLGIGQQLAGSPLGGEAARPPARLVLPVEPAIPDPGGMAKRAVDIVIPVYDSADETAACLQSIIDAKAAFGDVAQGSQIVVVNDGSTSGDLVALLEELAGGGKITLLHNERNLGFPTSVNRGFDLHVDRDIVVLNSDTIVFGNWLERLQAAAYSSPNIATVTPFSNEASILSYPQRLGDNPEPSPGEGAALDDIAKLVNAGITVDIPTAVGFCMFVRRDCLNQIGNFDVISFGRGYGEENDLCMRATEAGWRNIAAPDIFLSHAGGSSFGKSKKALIVRNTRILNGLHPGYDALVRDFIAADPLKTARRNIDMARLRQAAKGPAILLITLALGGGVARNVDEVARRHAAEGRKAFVLRPLDAEAGIEKGAVLVDPFDDSLCNLSFDLPVEMDILSALLADCRVGRVEIHHFHGLDASIFTIAGRLAVPYVVVLHDYSWVCPRINLVDGRGRYCGMPLNPEICDRCVAVDGSTLQEKIPVSRLRQRSAEIFAGADRVVAACNDVADRFAILAPDAAYEVAPWEDEPLFERTAVQQADGARFRVAVIGAVGAQKGYDLLLACARDAAIRDLPIEFVVVGFTSDDLSLFKTGRAFVTGRYDDAEAIELVRAQNCHFAFLPSISPETWSYSLTLAWKAGLPVLAFDFGAIAERIRNTGNGELIAFCDDEMTLNAALADFGAAVRDGRAFDSALRRGAGKTQVEILQGEHAIGSPLASIRAFDDSDRTSQDTLIALDPGLYAFSVKSDGEEGAPLPIVQISLAGGYSREVKVDFLGKHDPVENWLTERGDVVVVRVAGAACSLLIKCLRIAGEDMPSISVECQHLDRGEGMSVEKQIPAESDSLLLQITAHVQNRGDLPFVTPGWAGCVGERLWIEAFTINPLEGILPEEIEYKALTGTGFETPWSTGGVMCGTRGTSNPLVAFAVRLRGSAAERYECRYRGMFLGSGAVGQVRNGAACKSAFARDPLEGIELQVVRKTDDAPPIVEESLEPSLPEYEVVYGSY